MDSDLSDKSDSIDDRDSSVTEPFEDSKAVEFDPVATETAEQETEQDSDDDSEQQMSQDLSDLEVDDDYDEARTQYELAKVFVDLGDEDGARKILDELVANTEVSEEVMSDAQKLLESLQS